MNEKNQNKILANRYELKNQIGSGGMALVFEGIDNILERKVAIKILRSKFSNNQNFIKRFHDEAKAAANLTHPNIVTIYDYGFDQSNNFIVMEYVPNIDLNTMIKLNHKHEIQPITFRQGIDLIIQASKGLGYAHKTGIVHCDVKPHNFLVTSQNVLKITDFGIAQAYSSINQENQSDMIWGSPIYLSPEQAAGTSLTPASDMYSLGVIMYYLFSGKFPFVADTPEKLSYKHQFEKPVEVIQINPQIPQSLNTIIMKLLEKDPNDRFRSADHLAHVLIDSFNAKTPIQFTYLPTNNENSSNLVETTPTKYLSSITSQEEYQFNWKNILLTTAAVFLVGGIIPFWLWILLLL